MQSPNPALPQSCSQSDGLPPSLPSSRPSSMHLEPSASQPAGERPISTHGIPSSSELTGPSSPLIAMTTPATITTSSIPSRHT